MNDSIDVQEVLNALRNKIGELEVNNTLLEIQNGKLSKLLAEVEDSKNLNVKEDDSD